MQDQEAAVWRCGSWVYCWAKFRKLWFIQSQGSDAPELEGFYPNGHCLRHHGHESVESLCDASWFHNQGSGC